MPNRESLIQGLAELDPATLEEVVTAAYRQQAQRTKVVDQERPTFLATPQEFAHWVAKRHLSSDAAIERVVYLPTDSPADEIRLLEVNRFLNPPDFDLIEPLDFTPDTDPPFKVFVADVTTDQWERIKQAPETMLPREWKLAGNQTITR